MKYVQLGDQRASAIGLGVWQFGTEAWGWGSDLPESEGPRIIERAIELGINLFDTAELYGNGRSESILGQALAGRRDQVLIATKVTPTHLTYKGVLAAAQGSLQRLQTDWLDLYQVHWPNRVLPIAWAMRAMRELLQAGRIRAVGVSNFTLSRWRSAEAALGQPVIANQVLFNLIDQGPMRDLLPFAQRQGRVIIAYSPLAQGVLGGRYNADHLPHDFRAGRAEFSAEGFNRAQPLLQALDEVGRLHGATLAQVALAWLIRQPNVIAIPGARSLAQVESNAAAADLELSEDEAERLTALGREAALPALRRGVRPLLARLLGA
jgi:aryl-alcohol dehydrogenase-like predicted oxidoreductase